MRVLSISTSDFKGGAAKVAFYLTKGLRERGIEADLHVRDVTTDAPFVHRLPIREAAPRSLQRRVLGRLGLGHLAGPRLARRFAGPDGIGGYDLIHLHDVPGFLPGWIARHTKKPVVWTIHSMAPLTGGCLYAYDCSRWQEACGACPQFGTWPLIYSPKDESAEVLARKKDLYRAMHFHAVGVSQWITDLIGRSVMSDQPRHTVQNPSWTPDYYPIGREAARARLGVPKDAFAILVSVSGKIEDTRKGLDIVCTAMQQMQLDTAIAKSIFLLPTGIVAPSEELEARIKGLNGLAPRHLENAADLRDYYNAADVVWHPSRADNSPMVILEAAGCGTPVIAARVGGVPEIVEDGVSGLLIPPEDPEALAAATRRLLDTPALAARLRDGALAKARAHSPARFVDAYLAVYAAATAPAHAPARARAHAGEAAT